MNTQAGCRLWVTGKACRLCWNSEKHVDAQPPHPSLGESSWKAPVGRSGRNRIDVVLLVVRRAVGSLACVFGSPLVCLFSLSSGFFRFGRSLLDFVFSQALQRDYVPVLVRPHISGQLQARQHGADNKQACHETVPGILGNVMLMLAVINTSVIFFFPNVPTDSTPSIDRERGGVESVGSHGVLAPAVREPLRGDAGLHADAAGQHAELQSRESGPG